MNTNTSSNPRRRLRLAVLLRVAAIPALAAPLAQSGCSNDHYWVHGTVEVIVSDSPIIPPQINQPLHFTPPEE